MQEYWFKADVKFLCPSCKQQSVETIIACSENRHDPNAVAASIKGRVKPIVCQHCKTICPDGVQIQLGMVDLTPEELSKINFGSGPSSKGPM